jgi:hypothetical protein
LAFSFPAKAEAAPVSARASAPHEIGTRRNATPTRRDRCSLLSALTGESCSQGSKSSTHWARQAAAPRDRRSRSARGPPCRRKLHDAHADHRLVVVADRVLVDPEVVAAAGPVELELLAGRIGRPEPDDVRLAAQAARAAGHHRVMRRSEGTASGTGAPARRAGCPPARRRRRRAGRATSVSRSDSNSGPDDRRTPAGPCRRV